MNYHELTCTIAIRVRPGWGFEVRSPTGVYWTTVTSTCDHVFQRMSRFSDVGWEMRHTYDARTGAPELVVSNGHIKEFKDIPVMCEGGKIEIYYALAAHLRMMGAIANE